MQLSALSPEIWQAYSPENPGPVIDLMYQRKLSGSQRGDRQDGRVVAIASEGGGIAGVVPAGMLNFLEKTGLIDTIDVIYGSSSGALNGSYTASGQAELGACNYE